MITVAEQKQGGKTVCEIKHPTIFLCSGINFGNCIKSRLSNRISHLAKFSTSLFSTIIILLISSIFSEVVGQTTIVNYNFNSGTSYATLSPALASNITCAATSNDTWATGTGVASGGNAFTSNSTSGSSVNIGKSKAWTFTLGGTALSSYKTFKVYYQPKASAATGTLTFTYSLNGGAYTSTGVTASFGAIALSVPTSYSEVLLQIPSSADYPITSIAFQLAFTATANPNIDLDNFEVQAVYSVNTITTGAISGSPFCSGSSGISVPFTYSTAAAFGSGTSTFTAQLSNSSGSFSSPVNLQSVTSNASGSQSISVTIPSGTSTGTGYRIRVVSDTPSVTGSDNGSDLIVNSLPTVSSHPSTGTQSPCLNSTPTNLSITAAAGSGSISTYAWYSNTSASNSGGTLVATNTTSSTTNTYTPATSSAGTLYYYCIVTNSNGCTVTSDVSGAITVNALPSVSSHPSTGTQSLCLNSTPTDLSITAAAGSGTISTYAWYSNTSASNSGGTLVATNTSSSTTNTYTPVTSSAGTLYYYCIVTNSNGCTVTSNVSGAITVNALPSVSSHPSTSTQTLCLNATPTDLSITAAAGSGTISTYAWYSNTSASNSGGTLVATNTSSSTTNTYTPVTSSLGMLYYYCIVTNSNSCTVTSNVSGVINVATPTITLGISPTVCGGTTTASLPFVSTTGSPNQYTINYDGTAESQLFVDVTSYTSFTSSPISLTVPTAALAGTYNGTITVKNSSTGCVSTSYAFTVTITRPSVSASSLTQPSCTSDGSVNITASSGTAPYTYDWTDILGTNNVEDRTGLQSGTNYTVNVTDASGCTSSYSTGVLDTPVCTGLTVCKSDAASILSVPTDPANTTYTWTIESADSPGTFYTDKIATNGIPSISVNWTTVPIGTYTVTVVASNASCSNSSASTRTVYVQAPTVSASAGQACEGGNLQLYASGGVSYSWTGPNGFSSTSANPIVYNLVNGTHNGTYTVTATDADGCSASANVVVTIGAGPSIARTITNASCGSSTGSLDITPSGGTTYTYLWSTGATTQDISSLTSGNYTVTVTKDAGCSTQATYTVGNTGGPTASVGQTNVTCNGGSNGTITLTPSGGAGSNTYAWSASNGGVVPGGQTANQNLTALVAGIYDVVITDAAGCQGNATATITQYNVLLADVVSSNVTCNSSANGTITISNPTGGAGTYEYRYDTGSWQAGLSFTGLSPATYSVQIRDAVNTSCAVTLGNQTITQPAALSATVNKTNITCNGLTNGTITVSSPSGGYGTYQYRLDAGSWQSSGSFTGLSAATYSVQIRDAANTTCVVILGDQIISQPSVLSASVAKTNITCYGSGNGTITVSTPSGGNGTYEYRLNTGNWQSSGSFTALSAATYSVQIRDAAQTACYVVLGDQTITEPALLSATVGKSNITCNGANNGTITVSSPLGGYGTFEYRLNTGAWQSSGSFTSLTAGTYSVQIRDAAQTACYITLGDQTITNPSAISLSGVVTNVLCRSASTGAINITASGGTGTLTYDWGGGVTSEDRSSLAANTYTVTVSDANLCASSATSFTVTQPAAALSLGTTVSNISCNGGSNDGSITLSVGGGVSAYTYVWKNSALTTVGTTRDISGLTDDTYSVTVTDANSCTATTSAAVARPSALSASSITPTSPTCNGGTNGSINLTVTGGTIGSGYTYVWSNGSISEDPASLSAGNYSVTITDSKGCTATSSTTVAQPSAVAIGNVITNVSCNGGSTGAINITASGGTGAYTYDWADIVGTSNSEDRTSLAAGSYSVTVSDANSCTASASYTVTEPSVLSVSVTTTNRTCLSVNGGAQTSISGGTAPYTYSWTKNPSATVIGTTGSLSSIDTGTYAVSVTDANGCTASGSGTVSSPTCVAPTAVDDTYSTAYNTQIVNGSVTGNDSDANYANSLLSFTLLTSPTGAQGILNWDSSNNGTFTFTPTTGYSGTFTVNYRITNPVGMTDDGVISITVAALPTTATNESKSFCQTAVSVALSGNSPSVGTGSWSVISGPSTLSSQFSSTSNPTATFTPAGGVGNYLVRWTISNSPSPSSSADATITMNAVPTTATNGSAQSICNGSTATLSGNSPSSGIGEWSVVSGPSTSASQFSDIYDPTAIFTSAGGAGSYVVRWSIGTPCSTTTADATVTVNAIPSAPTVGTITQPSCGSSTGSVVLSGLPSGSWTITPSTGSVVNSSGSSYTFTGLSASTSYTFTVTALSCTSAATSSVVMNAQPLTPTITTGVITNPVACGGSGTIPLTFTNVADGSYTVSYTGGSFSSVSVSSNAATITTTVGTYNNLQISANGCTSATGVNATLTDPGARTIAFSSSSNPVTCISNDGSIVLSGLANSTSYTVNYKKDGTPVSATISSNGSGSLTIGSLSSGSYTNISVTASSCTSNTLAGPYALTDPGAPSIAHGTDVNPTTCSGTNGNISITGLTASTLYTVDYNKNGAGVNTAITSDGTGTLTIGSLSAGSYTNIYVTTAASCSSNTLAGAYTLSDPSLPDITTTGTATTSCYSASVQTTSLSYTSTSGSPTSYSIDWDNTANSAGFGDQGSTAFAFNSGTGALTGISITAATLAGTYNGTMTITNGNSCSNTKAVSVTISPVLSGNTSGSPVTICTGGSTTLTGGTVSGGSGSYTYLWESSSDGSSGWGTASGTSNATDYTTATLTADTWYRRTVTSGGCSDVAAVVKVTVNADPTISVEPSASTVCVGGTATLGVTATGGVGALSYQWQESNDDGATDAWASAVGGSGSTTNSYSAPTSSAGTIYYRVVVSNGGSGCGTATSASALVTVNADPTISVEPSASTVCVGGTATLGVTATGGVGALSYQWQESNDDGATDAWASAVGGSGSTTNSYSAPTSSAGTIYYRVVVSNGGSGCGTATSASALVTVNADPTISVEPSASTVCVGGTATLGVTATGGVGALSYQWQESNDDGATDAWASAVGGSGSTTNSYSAPTSSAGTIYYRVVVSNGGSGCGTATSASALVTVNADPTISVEPSASTVCVGGTATLGVTATGGVGALSYQWQESNDDGATDAWASAVGGSGSTTNSYSAPTSSAGTIYYRVVVSNGGSGCGTATSASALVTVNALPTVTFTAQPGASACVGYDVTYTTESGKSSYVWSVPGVLNTNYTITSGGISGTNNTVTLKWLTTGSKTVSVNYTNANGCVAASATSSTATVVSVCNTPPVITSDGGGATAAVSVAENTTAVTTVTATDVDLPAQTLTYSITGGADAGKFSINSSTGVLTFVTAPNFESPTDAGANNVYDLQVTVTDNGTGNLTDVQAIAVTVTDVNEPPVITSDGGGATAAVSVAENTTAVTTVTATDPDTGQTLTFSITGGADAGKFSINSSTGVLTFVTAPNFESPTDAGANNVYDLQVTVTDNGTGNLTDVQAIAVTVTNVNEPPVITSDGGGATAAVSVAENTTAVTTVTATDPDTGQTLTYSITGGADAGKFTINSSTGVLTFVTAPNFESPTDAGANNVYDLQVTVTDNGTGNLTDVQAIAVTVTDVNEPPVITSDGGGTTAAVSVAENTTAVTTVTATDPDAGQTLTFSITGGADAGKFSINSSTGVLTFVTAPNFESPTDADANNVYDLQVTVTDNGTGNLTDVQAIAVTVTNVNEPPVITSDGGGATAAVSVAENTTAVTMVTATDVDAGQTLAFSITGGADAAKFSINSSTGVLRFVTAPNFESPTDAGANNVYDLQVTVTDNGTGNLTDVQAIAVTVTDVNEPPVVSDIAKTGLEDNDIRFTATDFTSKYIDADGNVMTKIKIITLPANGTLKITGVAIAAGTEILAENLIKITFVPNANWNGKTTFNWNGNDGTVYATSNATVNITITAVNDAPVASATPVTTPEDTPVNGIVTATDVEGDALTFGKAADPLHGTVVVNADGTYTYTPSANYNGTDSFDVMVSDGHGGLDTISVIVTVTPVNDPPVAVNDVVNMLEDSSLTGFNLLANDTDPDGDVLTINTNPVSVPSHGTLVINPDGTFVYTPNADYNGIDSFTYKICDNGVPSKCAIGTVTITIIAVNDPPVAAALPVVTPEDTPVSGAVSATDVDGDSMTFSKTTDPLHGTVVVNIDGTYTYTPAPNYNGIDSFTVTVNDGNGGITSVTVNVTVTPVNDPPVASALPVTTPEDTPVSGAVTATDVDGDPLTFTKTTDPLHGKVVLNANGTYTYTPEADYFGADSFKVSVSDGNGGMVTVTVNITILSVNDAPSFRNGGNQIVCGNSGAQLVNGWAVPVSAGPANESGQMVQFTVSNNNNALFATQPDVDATGNLSYSVAQGQSGTATVSVQLADDGGTLNGGINTSAVQTFTITVNGLPTAPTVNSTQEFCGTATVSDLIASAPVGSTVSWFTTSTGGMPLSVNYALTNAMLYYAESTNSTTGCKSLTRTFVVPIIHDLTVAPVGAAMQQFCLENSPKVSDMFLAGLNLKWYTNATGGNLVSGTTALVTGTTYYASQTTNGCESTARTAVTGTVVTCNGPVATNNPPVISDIGKTTIQNQSFPFISTDFTSKFTDTNNDNLFKVRIESLPANGQLQLNGLTVTIGEEIPAVELGKLSFIPNKDYAGDTFFRWSGSDGKVYSVASANVNITIDPLTVFVPEGFSPNGDGINDYFFIKGADRFVVTLRVFNRWGNKVFESTHYKNDWDGASNVGMLITNQLPGGTYFYSVNFNNGEKEQIGYLTLNR